MSSRLKRVRAGWELHGPVMIKSFALGHSRTSTVFLACGVPPRVERATTGLVGMVYAAEISVAQW